MLFCSGPLNSHDRLYRAEIRSECPYQAHSQRGFEGFERTSLLSQGLVSKKTITQQARRLLYKTSN